VASRTGSAAQEENPLVRSLLVAGLERLRDGGLRVGAITVNSQDRPLVHEARSLGFMHDRTDVQYAVRKPVSVEPRKET
jgi:mycothiol synthase